MPKLMASSRVNPLIFLVVVVAPLAIATSHQHFVPRSLPPVQNPNNDLAFVVFRRGTFPLSHLVRQEQEDNFIKSSGGFVFPAVPANSTPSTYTLLQEIAVWNPISLFSALLNVTDVLPKDFGAEPYVVLAPTLFAFQAFFRRIGVSEDFLLENPQAIFDRLNSTFLQSGLLQEILRYHIIPGNFTEQQLVSLGKVTTLQGAELETKDFPIVVDDEITFPMELFSKRRVFRSIETRQGRLMMMNRVLHPFNLSEQLEGSDLEFGPPLPFDIDGVDRFFLNNPFLSFRDFIAERNDLVILNALYTIFQRQLPVLPFLGHFFVPTDTAFISLFLQLLGNSADIDEDDPVPGIIAAAEGVLVLANITGIPTPQDILLYHILETGATYESLIGEESLEPLYVNATLSVTNDGVVDNDRSRGPAQRIGTFPTRQGCVTVIDSVLLPFDSEIARTVISANLNANEQSGEVCPDAEGECFAGDATVQQCSGRRVRMTDVQAGDEVHVDADGTSSKIFLFTHRSLALARFMELETESGRSIRLTKGHYLYANGRLVIAASVKVGDVLETESGNEKVVRVGWVVRKGKFAPHSVHGDLMVDGVRVSSYTKAVSPKLAHSVLAPVRAAATWGNVKEPLGSVLYDGAAEWWLRPVSWLFGGADRY